MELVSLAQLERTHRRHDEVMASLLEAARRLAAGRPDTTDVSAVHEAVAYFQRAVTRHFVDLEGSVFPRLSSRRPDLAPELAALSAEHPNQIELHALIAAAADELDTQARPAAGMALLDVATRLASLHRAHVSRKDVVFAEAAGALTAQDDLEIQTEMETRRDREPGTPAVLREVTTIVELAKATKPPMKQKAKTAAKKPVATKAKAAPAKKKPAPKKSPTAKKPQQARKAKTKKPAPAKKPAPRSASKKPAKKRR
ncbi:MAG TPA: hemerythrin domain-containing protein [Kofleriaceae bacterium]|jgi:hypothetical protein